MKYTELKNDIAVSDRRIYLFEGEDAYFRAHGEEQVKRAFLSMPELNFASFDGGALKGKQIENLTSAMAAYPFMAEKRVIRVGEFYPSEADYDKYLKAAFENCPPSTILVIVNQSAGKGAQLKRKKCITYVDCSRADEDTVTRWVYATLKRAGIYADVSACRNVAAYCLCDMSRVEGEVDEDRMLYEVARYNFASFIVKDFDLAFNQLGPVRMMEIKPFNSFDEVRYYMYLLYRDGEMAAKLSGLRPVIISQHNFDLLMKYYSFDDYARFYEENFGELPSLDEELELPEGGDTLDEPLQNLPELPEGEEYEPEEEIIEEDVFID